MVAWGNGAKRRRRPLAPERYRMRSLWRMSPPCALCSFATRKGNEEMNGKDLNCEIHSIVPRVCLGETR